MGSREHSLFLGGCRTELAEGLGCFAGRAARRSRRPRGLSRALHTSLAVVEVSPAEEGLAGLCQGVG